MWTKARLAAYITTAIIGIAIAMKQIGLAEYDPATSMFDLHPVNIYAVAGMVAGPLASALAAVAVWFGWGSK